MRPGGHKDTPRHARVDEHLRLVHVPGLYRDPSAPDLRGIHFRAIDRDDERVRRVVALDAGVAFLDAPDQGDSLLASPEHMADHRAAACSERQAVDVSVLAELPG